MRNECPPELIDRIADQGEKIATLSERVRHLQEEESQSSKKILDEISKINLTLTEDRGRIHAAEKGIGDLQILQVNYQEFGNQLKVLSEDKRDREAKEELAVRRHEETAEKNKADTKTRTWTIVVMVVSSLLTVIGTAIETALHLSK
jgi:hypothetical protein